MTKNLSTAEIPAPREKLTDRFRALKMGETITIRATHYETAHSTARLVKIRVSTKVKQRLENGGGFVMDVTRIKPRVAAAAQKGAK